MPEDLSDLFNSTKPFLARRQVFMMTWPHNQETKAPKSDLQELQLDIASTQQVRKKLSI